MKTFARRCLSGLVALSALPVPAASQDGAEVARAYREAHEVEIVREFAELLTFPNRARDAEDIGRAAAYIRDRLQEVGVESEVLEIDGSAPLVYGELIVPGATRTLGIYAHYDGQPVDPSNWTHPPFEPTLYTASMEAGGSRRPLPETGSAVDPEWRIYARSAGDDKAPIAALLPVLRSFGDAGVTPTSNLIFFLDGEEEAGSRHLDQYMEMQRDRIDNVDIWLFFDGPAHQSGRPQITFGVRGAMGMEVTVYGATRNLHSGHYGNWAPDTGNILARLLTSMKDDSGRVLIDGWYDTTDPIGAEERAALEGMPDYDDELKRELGLVRTEGEPQTLPERLMVPALNVRGITSGNTGSLARNVIPNTAVAALGIRLVKGNDSAHLRQLVVDHIEGQGFHVVSEDPAQRDHGCGQRGGGSRVRRRQLGAVPGDGRDAAPLPFHGRRRQARHQRPRGEPRQQSARSRRESADRESVVRDRPLRSALDDAGDRVLRADGPPSGSLTRSRRRTAQRVDTDLRPIGALSNTALVAGNSPVPLR